MAYRDRIEALLSEYEGRLASAFLEAIDDIRNSIVLRRIVERLERGDINGAIEAMGLDPIAFERLERAMEEAYAAGGDAEVNNLPILRDPSGARLAIRFGMRNTPGERELREHSSTLVTRIVDDQREAIRAALSDGLARGDNPRVTALDVIGRVERGSNRRVGGIIGLTAPQERFVAKARAELLAGDEDSLRAYLTRERRDKRFDRTILKAIKEGKPLPRDVVNKIAGRYSDRLLELRGEMLARTETMTTLNKGRFDAIQQQIASGRIEARDVTKKWLSVRDARVRLTHAALNGQTAPYDGVFISPSGAMLRYPGDMSAPASEVVGCRCVINYQVDALASIVRRFRAEAV